MNNIQLFEAIGLVDDELLKQCTRKETWKKYRQLFLAACITLPVLVIVFFISRCMIIPKSRLSDMKISQELLSCFIQITQIDTDGFRGTIIGGVQGNVINKNEDIYVSFNSDTTFTNSEGNNIEYNPLDINEWKKQPGDIVVVSFSTYTSERIYAVQVSEAINDLIYRNIQNSFNITISDTEKAILNWNGEITISPSSTIYLYNISEEKLCNITDSCEKGKSIPLEMTGTYIVLESINNDFAVMSPDYYNIKTIFVSNDNNIIYLGGVRQLHISR